MTSRSVRVVASDLRAVATRLERLAPTLPSEASEQAIRTARLLRDHADRVTTRTDRLNNRGGGDA
jgi:hypothetical protein